jgi:hypothetical protein
MKEPIEGFEDSDMRTEGLESLMMFFREDKIMRRERRNQARTERLRLRIELRDLSRLRINYIRVRLRRIGRRLERLEGRRQDVLWYFKNKWLEDRGRIFG